MLEQYFLRYTLSDYRNLLRMSQNIHLLVPGQKEKKLFQSYLDGIGDPKWQERLNIVIDSAQNLIRFENQVFSDGSRIIKELFSTIRHSVCAKKVMGFMDHTFQEFEPNEAIQAKTAEYKYGWELLSKMVKYQFAIQELETKWNCSFEELQIRYTLEGIEDFEADDDYLLWQWYIEALYTIKPQIQKLIGI